MVAKETTYNEVAARSLPELNFYNLFSGILFYGSCAIFQKKPVKEGIKPVKEGI